MAHHLPGEAQDWARKWIESHMDKWWDPWGNDIHHDLAVEFVRMVRWGECAQSSPDGGPPPYFATRMPTAEWEPPVYTEYDFDTGEEAKP